MAYIKKYKFIIMILLLAFSIAGVFIWRWKLYVEEKQWVQTLKHSEEPDLMAYMFLRYLRESKIAFAKELVIPEQRGRIEKWIVDSKHETFKCSSPYLFNQILASGGGSSKEIDNHTILQSDSYGCNFSENSMSVNDVMVHYTGSEWVIMDWSEICETKPSKIETCYQ